MSELVWVAVPGGRDGSGPVLRVLVVPKLDGGTLRESGMATWPPPALVDPKPKPTPTLLVQWRAGSDEAVTDDPISFDRVRFEVQPGLWSRFFGPDTPVGSPRRGAAAEEVEVRRTTEDAARIGRTFAAPVAVEVAADEPLPTEFGEQVIVGLDEWAGRDGGRRRRRPPPGPPADPPPPPGFQRIVSLLREHPAVLRALGLIFEVRVTAPAGMNEGEVKIGWPGSSADPDLPPIVSPWTAFGRTFRPRSTATISAGMVTLTADPDGPPNNGGGWKVVTVDVDGGARRLADAVAALAGDSPVSLPAMRTAGVQLVREDREGDFLSRARTGTDNAGRDLNEHVLDADGLVLGYRIDIRRGGGPWRSLHERRATYELDETPIGSPGTAEEGHVKVNGAVREDEGPLQADEVVARWSGWSLAVTRPRFDATSGASGPSRLPGLPFRFTFGFEAAEGSLPRLRFAARYSMRARVVDMAGGGLALDASEADRCAIQEIAYRRYEPVSSPGVMLEAAVEPKALGPAETADTVVVRSSPEIGVDDFAGQNPGYTTHARRVLHRPTTSLAMAEQHRMLDGVGDEETFVWVQRAVTGSAAGDGEGGPLPDPASGGVLAFPRREPAAPDATMTPQDWSLPWPQPEEPAKTIELRGRGDGEATLRWEGRTLVVRLAPAEQLTVELSSTLTENFLDHFALQDGMPDKSLQAAQTGRHPLITPSRPVTLVHAVRRPRFGPDLDARLEPEDRDEGQTFAVLDPQPEFLGLDNLSTAQLDVTASWRERDDDQVREILRTTVQSVAIGRVDEVLSDQLRHEFGDTRHRDVSYTLSAVTRFRQFFLPSPPEDPKAFVSDAPLAPVSIPSTARPDPPVVLSTRPAFEWADMMDSGPDFTTRRRERHGGRLRVELARPWYQTGDGERLAVIVWDRAAGDPPGSALPYVTQIGRDPIWDTPGPERWPTPDVFAGTAGEVGTPTLVETGDGVLAVPFEPWFHDGRWYADIAISRIATSSYCPLVQLAVARYQPESIDGLDLSRVVLTEMVPLLPNRSLTVTRTLDGTFVVSLKGTGPAGPRPNRVDIVLEQCQLPPGASAHDVDLVAVEAAGGGPTAWVPGPGQTRHVNLNDDAPSIQAPAGVGPFRIRVREVELVGADPGIGDPGVGPDGELTERTVFVDAVDLPPDLSGPIPGGE